MLNVRYLSGKNGISCVTLNLNVHKIIFVLLDKNISVLLSQNLGFYITYVVNLF